MKPSELPQEYKNLAQKNAPTPPPFDDLEFWFVFSKTPEGYDFWSKVGKATCIEELPPIPMNTLPHPKELEPFLAEAEAIVADCDKDVLVVKMIFSRQEAAYHLQFSNRLDDRYFTYTGPRAIDIIDGFRRAYRLPPKPKTASERIAELEAEIARIRAEEVANG